MTFFLSRLGHEQAEVLREEFKLSQATTQAEVRKLAVVVGNLAAVLNGDFLSPKHYEISISLLQFRELEPVREPQVLPHCSLPSMRRSRRRKSWTWRPMTPNRPSRKLKRT